MCDQWQQQEDDESNVVDEKDNQAELNDGDLFRLLDSRKTYKQIDSWI